VALLGRQCGGERRIIKRGPQQIAQQGREARQIGSQLSHATLDDYQLCGRIYGFPTLFDREPLLGPPRDLAELQERVATRLYTESSAFVDEHALRVKTDDDEVDIAYFVLDDSFAPARTAYMLHEDFELPADAADAPYTPRVPVTALRPGGDGAGATYVVFLTGYDSASLDLDGPRVIPGVRLPDLADHLRRIEPDVTETAWPRELLLLRAMLADPALDLAGALRACNAFPIDQFGGAVIGDAGLGPLARAHAAIEALRGRWEREPEHVAASQLQITPHLVQGALRLHLEGAYHQWIVFDDRWAAAHRDLADSLLAWATHWDVLD